MEETIKLLRLDIKDLQESQRKIQFAGGNTDRSEEK